MNPGIMPASRATQHLVKANKSRSSNAGFPGDFQELWSFAMDQAIGIEKASLGTVVSLNSCLVDIYKCALWSAPVFGNLLGTISQAVACATKLQMNWLTLLAPYALSDVSLARSSDAQSPPTPDELSHSMDVAIGASAAAPCGTMAKGSGDEEATENSMDAALGMKAA